MENQEMKQVHNHEKEQFKKLFRQELIDRFEDRFLILEVFLQTERHITVSGLTELLRKQGVDFTPEFVLETLKLMCQFGFAQTNTFDNGEVYYEHRHLGQHHDHMICTKCRSIVEFEDEALEALQLQIARARGFHMLQHKMEIYGICDSCLKERIQGMPLSMAKAGERLQIEEFTGGASSRMRLRTMGLRPGDRIEVITNHRMGQVVVATDFHRFVLGRGLAQKVMVQPLNPEDSRGGRQPSKETG
ncbi:MAG: transcriptional repressor [Desulfobacterales bacterium]|nr:transcriptional repressor [Desulfobacterales bacterium]